MGNALYLPLGALRTRAAFAELASFGLNNALSCIFPVLIFVFLGLSRRFEIPFLPRYDALLLACLGAQAWMVKSGLETKDELKVITIFHLLGLLMEIQKVRVGSWAYPEQAYSKLCGVPLYSGFMYASVASFMCQAWRRLDLRFVAWPARAPSIALGALIYLNFFTNHYIPDVRLILMVGVAALFFRTKVEFTCAGSARRMPMILAFLFIASFLWGAENIATYLGAWKYPYQMLAWHPVHLEKLGSWFVLAIVSLIIVGELKLTKRACSKIYAAPSSPPSW